MPLFENDPPDRPGRRTADIAAITAELREAVADAVDSAVPPGSGARSVGRSLGLTKTMGWKLWTLATSDDAERAVAAIPGDQGWAIMLQALASSDVPKSKVERVRTAMESYRKAMGDTPGTETAAGEGARRSSAAQPASAIERAKRDAVRAAALLTGIRARAFIAVLAILPEGTAAAIELDEERRVCIARAGVVRGIERTRPGPPYPLLDGVLVRLEGGDPIDQLVPELCTPGSIGKDFAAGEGDAAGSIVLRARESRPGGPLDLAFVAHAPTAAQAACGPALQVPLPCDRLELVLVLPDSARSPHAELRVGPAVGSGPAAGASWVTHSVCVESTEPTEGPSAPPGEADTSDRAAAGRLAQCLAAREPRIAGQSRLIRYSFAFPPPGAAVLLRFDSGSG